jgi:hypothetical protein
MKFLHHALENRPSVMLEYFNDLFYLKRAHVLLKMILSLAIHHHYTCKKIIIPICDRSHDRDVSIRWHPGGSDVHSQLSDIQKRVF